MASTLLRRILLVSASGIAACGGRADLESSEFPSVADAGAGGTSSNAGAGGATAGSGGATAGSGGASAGSGGATAGAAGATAGAAGAAAVCSNPKPVPVSDEGSFLCDMSGGFGLCELKCYVPGPTTIPGACVAFDDPALVKLPGFEYQSCGFNKPTDGPYCDATAEKYGGAKPICCYLGLSQPCAGRPLRVEQLARVAPLTQGAWG